MFLNSTHGEDYVKAQYWALGAKVALLLWAFYWRVLELKGKGMYAA